jgi:molybdopterin converting factor small subunit
MAAPSSFQIIYFSTASSYTGKQTEILPAPLPLNKLFDLLEERYPGIRGKVLASCAVTLDLEYVEIDDGVEDKDRVPVMIKPGDEVGIIPPVSSG